MPGAPRLWSVTTVPLKPMQMEEALDVRAITQTWRPWEAKRLNQLQRVDLLTFANKQPQLKRQDFPTLTSNLSLTEIATIPSTLQIQSALIAEDPMLNPILFVQD